MSTTETMTDLAAHLRDHADRIEAGAIPATELDNDVVKLYDLALEVGMDDVADALTYIDGWSHDGQPLAVIFARDLRSIAAELIEEAA